MFLVAEKNMERAEHFKKVVNKEKRTVTMILEGCELDAVIAIQNRSLVGMEDDLDLGVALMPDKFVSVVKCADEDEFDEVVGANIAAHRVMLKHQKAFNNAIKRWQDYMVKQIANVNQQTFKEVKGPKCTCQCKHKK